MMTDILTKDQIQTALGTLEGWKAEGKMIAKDWEFEDFTEAMDFVNHVASIAEEHDHHPDIDIRWNKVRLVLATHSKGGVTESDLNLAEAIEDIAE